jgi:hypothetical protein
MARFGRSYIQTVLIRPVKILFASTNFQQNDAEGLTDSAAFVQTHTVSTTDSEGLSDSFTSAQTHVLSISDSMGLTDTFIEAFNPIVQSDSFGLTDSVSFNQFAVQPENPAESMGLTDSLQLTLGWIGSPHQSYHSSGFGELFIDRTYVIEKEKATEGNDGKLSLAGQESYPPSPLELVTFLHGQLVGLQEGKMVPVTFTDKAQRDGYYEVAGVTSDLTNYQNGDVVTADWTVELKRIGSESEIDLQSRLTGATRANDFALSGTKWHAPAIGHYAYHTGSTIPTGVSRTTSDGVITVYLSVPNNTSPRWGCSAVDYRGGRVRVFDSLEVSSENEVQGIDRRISANGWTLFNGLVNLQPTSSAGVVNVAYWDGTSYVDAYWKLQRGGVNLTAFDSCTILRNDYEQSVIRCVTKQSSGAGRTTVDFALKRGSRFIEGYMQNSSSATLKIAPNNTTSSASGTGYQVASAGTNRVACGSSKTFTVDNTNGGISKASVTAFDFWIGPVMNAASPATGDSATELRDQYIGSMPEIVYAVRR